MIASWDNITWDEPLPYGDELPDNQYDELATTTGGANMTGNAGLWHLDNNDLSDSSGSGNDGTAGGGLDCTGDSGKIGTGCLFDGTDDYINVSTDALNFQSDFTICIWINTNDAGSYQTIFLLVVYLPHLLRTLHFLYSLVQQDKKI